MNRVWFTADTHFGHKNVIKYSNRPFSDVEEMNRILITNWNAKVKPGDRIYHLGDFALGLKPKQVEKLLTRLNGAIHLIYGNHDHKDMRKKVQGFQEITPYKEIKIEGQAITLLHYAMAVWNKQHYGAWQLHGHSHNTKPRNFNLLQLDVGVDCWNYTPISFDEVAEEIMKSKFTPVDGHHKDGLP